MINELATKLAKDIFDELEHNGDKCQRLAAKGGKWPETETDLGGLCEPALAERIEVSLRKHIGAETTESDEHEK